MAFWQIQIPTVIDPLPIFDAETIFEPEPKTFYLGNQRIWYMAKVEVFFPPTSQTFASLLLISSKY